MTKVLHLASRRAGISNRTKPARNVQTFARKAQAPTLEPVDPVTRQAAIENALCMALYFVRQPGDTVANVWAATARTNRALTLLKQASQGKGVASPQSPARDSFGRA